MGTSHDQLVLKNINMSSGVGSEHKFAKFTILDPSKFLRCCHMNKSFWSEQIPKKVLQRHIITVCLVFDFCIWDPPCIPAYFGILLSKFLMKNIFICGFQKISKFSIISKIMGDMKMNQKGKMQHLMCSLRLCSLKLHWITFLLPRLINFEYLM